MAEAVFRTDPIGVEKTITDVDALFVEGVVEVSVPVCIFVCKRIIFILYRPGRAQFSRGRHRPGNDTSCCSAACCATQPDEKDGTDAADVFNGAKVDGAPDVEHQDEAAIMRC